MRQRNAQTVMVTAALGIGLLLQATLAAAAEPAARPATPAAVAQVPYVKGVVVSRTSLHVRSKPSTSAKAVGSLNPFAKVGLTCQAKGSWVEGNNVWYRLHGKPGWVAARFVHNYTPVRWC